MNFAALWTAMTGRSARQVARRRPGVRLGVESLELRATPSGISPTRHVEPDVNDDRLIGQAEVRMEHRQKPKQQDVRREDRREARQRG